MDERADLLKDPQKLWGVGEVLKLSIPTAMGMINSTVMQFIDGLMVAQIGPLGPEALSAQFSAGILSFVPQALMMGTLTVVNTFVAQNYGAGRLHKCSQYTWAALFLAAAWSLAVLPLIPAAGAIFAAVGHEPVVQHLEVIYFRYMIVGQLAFLASRVLESFFYGTQRPVVVYVTSLAANAINFVAALVLIFGRWGLPAMGLAGAGLATLIGQTSGLAILAAFFLYGKARARYDTRGQVGVRRRQVLDLLRIGWPAGFQMSIDVLGWALVITLLVGNIPTVNGIASPEAGTVHLTASTVALRYAQLAFMPTIGISIAATALVGRYIGERRLHLVRRRVLAALLLGVGYMGLCGLAFWIFRRPLMSFYLTLERPSTAALIPQIVEVGSKVLIVGAIFQVFDAAGIIFIGALRGAGDTLWPMAVSAALMVGVILGGGWLMLKLFPQLESLGAWIACAAYVIVLGITMLARFEAGKWRQIDLLGIRPPVH